MKSNGNHEFCFVREAFAGLRDKNDLDQFGNSRGRIDVRKHQETSIVIILVALLFLELTIEMSKVGPSPLEIL